MICFGQRGARRIGLHRHRRIGRATMYGRELLHVIVCPFCDDARVEKEPA